MESGPQSNHLNLENAMNGLEFIIDKLRLLAHRMIPGVADLMLDYEDAEVLVAEIDRLREVERVAEEDA